jgi:hypothetical protein
MDNELCAREACSLAIVPVSKNGQVAWKKLGTIQVGDTGKNTSTLHFVRDSLVE